MKIRYVDIIILGRFVAHFIEHFGMRERCKKVMRELKAAEVKYMKSHSCGLFCFCHKGSIKRYR